MAAEVTANLGNRSDIITSRIITVLNLSQDRLARLRDFPELRNVKVGTASADPRLQSGVSGYNLAAILGINAGSIRRIHSIRRDDGTWVKEIPVRRGDETTPQPDFWATGAATHYIREGDKVYFFTTPGTDDGLIVSWSAWPTALTTGSTSDFDGKDDILIGLTTALLFKSLGEHSRSDNWLQDVLLAIRNSADIYEEGMDLSMLGVLKAERMQTDLRSPRSDYYVR